MKTILRCFLLSLAIAFLNIGANAQGFILSSFQCDPVSCVEETAFPVFAGTAFVSFDAACTGGAIGPFEGSSKADVGLISPCNTPFKPRAEIDRVRTMQLDDCGGLFNLDTVRLIAEIFDPSGNIVFLKESGVSCDGGTEGGTQQGQKPC